MMAKRLRPRAFLAVALLAAGFAGPLRPAQAAEGVATLLTGSGSHALSVEVADTPKTREVGLMNRREMAADHGMLFDFGETRPVAMWMKNTLIPLDMLFMDERGTVTRVKERAKPESLDIIPSGQAVRYVLELNGGTAARLGVKAGDRLRHDIIPAGAPQGSVTP